jgi:hypothetical protein
MRTTIKPPITTRMKATAATMARKQRRKTFTWRFLSWGLPYQMYLGQG